MGPPPVVTGISPKEGPPGTRVTIRGEFLGTSVTDLIGLKICGCDCLLSAEWKSKNKIVARSGPCKGRGDIIVTTRSGGEGTSTVQFRGYHESIGPVKESAVWVEEVMPPSLPWGRRPMSPTAYIPPDPLGLSTEGDDCKFPEEELHELFPDGSGKLTDENFQPCWYLLEHHSVTSFEDLKAGMVFLQRKVESQKEGQLSFLKSNTGAVMDQLDRLVLIKNMFEDDQRKNGKEPLPSLQDAIEESISIANSLFSEILSRKEHADKTREALSVLTRHKFLFQLPASIDKNIKKKEYDLVVNDYTRAKNLFGNTDVQLFQKILAEIDKKIEDLKEKLYNKLKMMPINVQEQIKYIKLLISLNWEGDAAWTAITSRHEYLMTLLNKIKDHFKQKEEQETSDKGKRKGGGGAEGGAGGGAWGAARGLWAACACAALASELAALWPLARRYFNYELAGDHPPTNHNTLKEMITTSVELFCTHMRACLLSGGGSVSAELMQTRLAANLRHLRDAYDALLKLDLPSQPLSAVERVIFEYRSHGAAMLLQRAHKKVKSIAEHETWTVEQFSQYGAITNLPSLLERYIEEALSSIHKVVFPAGRREAALFADNSPAADSLHRLTQHTLLAYKDALKQLAIDDNDGQDFNNSCLSQTLDQRLDETIPVNSEEQNVRSWQQKLLITGANAQYTRKVTLNNIVAAFENYTFPKPVQAIAVTREALSGLETIIAETYLEHKGDPLVGTIEPSMYMSQYKVGPDAELEDARPYVYEIINNLIAVHAEVDAVCGAGSGRYMRDICETVMEELSRLEGAAAAPPAAAPPAPPAQRRLEYLLLRRATATHLTPAAMNHLQEALDSLPPLKTEEEKRKLDTLLLSICKRMELQLACLNCDMETI